MRYISLLTINLMNELTILGNNEQGKSTILEAINLALTSTLNKRNIHNELNPFLLGVSIILCK